MRSLIAVMIAIALPPLGQAQGSLRTDEEILAQAEAAFQRGVENKSRFLLARAHFSDATNRYLELHRRGIRTPALYRSLCNAAVLADRWPEAIWAYHVGLKLDPNDAVMREHLDFARRKVLYPPSGEGRLDADTWPAWLHRPTIFELLCVFVGAYSVALAFGTLGLRRWHVGVSRFAFLGWIAGLALLIAVGSGAGLWHEQGQAEFDRNSPLVIIAENTAFYQGNATSYPQHAALPMLPRGLEARQIHARGNWVQIRLSTGQVGWLPRERVLIVEP
jgi:hypothetical protein